MNSVDHLVNNAGVTNMALFEEITDITSFKQIMVIIFFVVTLESSRTKL